MLLNSTGDRGHTKNSRTSTSSLYIIGTSGTIWSNYVEDKENPEFEYVTVFFIEKQNFLRLLCKKEITKFCFCKQNIRELTITNYRRSTKDSPLILKNNVVVEGWYSK